MSTTNNIKNNLYKELQEQEKQVIKSKKRIKELRKLLNLNKKGKIKKLNNSPK